MVYFSFWDRLLHWATGIVCLVDGDGKLRGWFGPGFIFGAHQ